MQDFNIDDDIPLGERTLAACWRNRVRRGNGTDFLWYRGLERPLHIYEVDRRVRALRAQLRGRTAKGERVCVLMRTSPEMLVTMLALWSEGAVVVPLNPELQGDHLRDQLRRAEPALFIVDGALIERAAASARGVLADTAILAGSGPAPAGFPSERTLDHDATDVAEVSEIEIAWSDPALILFTSGSTGPAKGCVLSNHACVYYGWVFGRHMGYREDDRIYTCLPLNHVHGLFASFWAAIFSGARFAFAERFSASRYWQDLAESGATTCSAIGPMASILMRQDASEWERKARVRVAHIAPAPPFARQFEERFGLKIVSALYGLTEAMAIAPDPDREPVTGLLGRATRDWELEIQDESGLRCGVDEIGELVVRPRRPGILFDGYYGQPEQTLAAFKELWFHTGDRCRMDASGDVWFIGRFKDVIRRRGENVSAWQIEVAVTALDDVQEAAAVPVDSGLGDENIALFVVRSGGSSLVESGVARFCEDNLPRFMRPDRITVQEHELPRTASGKIDKPALRRMTEGGGRH